MSENRNKNWRKIPRSQKQQLLLKKMLALGRNQEYHEREKNQVQPPLHQRSSHHDAPLETSHTQLFWDFHKAPCTGNSHEEPIVQNQSQKNRGSTALKQALSSSENPQIPSRFQHIFAILTELKVMREQINCVLKTTRTASLIAAHAFVRCTGFPGPQ
jgi:hypothetical protein